LYCLLGMREMIKLAGSGVFLGRCILFAVSLLCFSTALPADGSARPDLGWPKISKEQKPWTYWWWPGSAVDKEGLTEHLTAYSKAGIGGVHIIPIYGVKGKEDRFIEYLCPRWMQMLAHTVSQADKLGMGVDMSTGTGWPFGGPDVDFNDASKKIVLRTYELTGGQKLEERIRFRDERTGRYAPLKALMAFSQAADAKILALADKLDPQGHCLWTPPEGKWRLYALFLALGGKKVERAAPGGAGYVTDPFSSRAMRHYLSRFDRAFASYEGPLPRAQYHDSYEYHGANWTDDLFEQFKRRRGYDLRRYLPALFGEGDEDVVARVKCDYRETISELHREYIQTWTDWSGNKGFLTRNQAHGSPSNLLDTYAAADIPETEIFGPSGFKIPGLRIDPDFDFHSALNNPLMLKLASSAAHVTGKNLVSSESCTWLGEHFKVSLSQVKPEIDQLFVSGVNHIFYHGMAYSPFDEDWPGWLFYASTNFGPTNSFWRDLPQLNAYVARCQSILQAGRPDNEILLYLPIYDLWHNKGGMLITFRVHNTGEWLGRGGFYETAKQLWERGYSFDYISDRLLTEARTVSGRVRLGKTAYRAVIVPACRFMPLRTLEKLLELARAGATVIVVGHLPDDVPGMGRLEERRKAFRAKLADIEAGKPETGFTETHLGKGRFFVGADLERMLGSVGLLRESMVDAGIEYIRRRCEDGYFYFIVNLSSEHIDGWVNLAVEAESVLIMDPLFQERLGLAAISRGDDGHLRCYLQLEPGRSLVLRTFSRRIDGPKWRYVKLSGRSYEIKGTWQVDFIEGGPKLPAGFQTRRLASWTELGDAEAQRFAGTARYRIRFDKPECEADEWILDLGRVCESARVTVNGRYVATLWSIPFRTRVGRFLHPGENTLEVEVTNLCANRIRDLDRRKVNWKKFYEINFVDIRYQRFDASDWPLMDSGLLGPVHLAPAEYIEPRP